MIFKKNNIYYTAILAIFFIMTSCSPSSQQSNAKNIQDVHTGTQGLQMEFLKNTPPKIVFEQTSFPAMLRIKNLGTSSIPLPGTLPVAIISLGVERDYTSSIQVEVGGRITSENDNEASFTLEGKTPLNTKGDEEVVAFTLTASKIDPQSETHPSSVIASICYPYRTELAASVCIDPDPNNVKPLKKSCTVKDVSGGSGQGAPVAITKIEVQMLPSSNSDSIKPQFLIEVENKGNGEVTKLDSYLAICRKTNGQVTYKDFNAIKIEAKLSGKSLECSLRDPNQQLQAATTQPTDQKYVILKSKKGVVRCSYPESDITKSSESYTAPLTITLDYGYTQSLAADYVIKKR